jgi:hypothetical protein
MNNPIYIIKNGSLQKVADINAQLLPGDLIRYNSKFYKVLYRAVEAKSTTNEKAYIVEEFNPLA